MRPVRPFLSYISFHTKPYLVIYNTSLLLFLFILSCIIVLIRFST
ncbi:hypothetical protein HMPREF1869_00716 [Bacteroidales bacterium KA00251]|nr:hypothetical protein HMPREF1869_00716 [Bacteroidales bacterium KA00251]